MRNSSTSKITRIAAGIIGMMMLVIVMFSAFFIAAEKGHHCCGEDCPVCVTIQLCENMLRTLGDGTIRQFSALVPVLFLLLVAAIYVSEVSEDTLVSQKVRLNN